MRNAQLFVGLVILLWGTSTVTAQDNCWVGPCDPCGGRVAASDFFGNWTFGGWTEMGVYTNSRGFNNNGPMHTSSIRRNDLILNQLVLSLEREMDTRRGWDWGGRAAIAYGAHGGSMQTYGDETFDYGWGRNRHGYDFAMPSLYGTLGIGNLSVKAGKFGTTIGWEGSESVDNFFYSRSYCYWIEPATHMGVLGTYEMTDRLSVSAGWTTGMDSSFSNPNNSHAVLTGFTLAMSDDAAVHYWINAGKQGFEFEEGLARLNYFVQSLCLEWDLTNRFTYMVQYNLFNGEGIGSSYGINNHFLYKLNDQWGAGMRFEWLRDNGGFIDDNSANYYQVSWGLNWNPLEHVSIRPEIRYDWVRGATPFGNAESRGGWGRAEDSIGRSTQLSGGCGIVVKF